MDAVRDDIKVFVLMEEDAMESNDLLWQSFERNCPKKKFMWRYLLDWHTTFMTVTRTLV